MLIPSEVHILDICSMRAIVNKEEKNSEESMSSS